jgi:16S rRNA (guanine(966)-N(2))-methyltransferase RsmD
MRTQLRIVAGSLKGRKVSCTVAPDLRPMPDRVRESLFNILADAVVDRAFYDLFAGTGAVGLEALSRGASEAEFIERDGRLIGAISGHLQSFGMASQACVRRADVYRWAERWQAPAEPVIIFLGPPYPDYAQQSEELMRVIRTLQGKVAPGSILVLQSEKSLDTLALPAAEAWDHRQYGRNQLSFWTRTNSQEEQ